MVSSGSSARSAPPVVSVNLIREVMGERACVGCDSKLEPRKQADVAPVFRGDVVRAGDRNEGRVRQSGFAIGNLDLRSGQELESLRYLSFDPALRDERNQLVLAHPVEPLPDRTERDALRLELLDGELA